MLGEAVQRATIINFVEGGKGQFASSITWRVVLPSRNTLPRAAGRARGHVLKARMGWKGACGGERGRGERR